MFLLFMCKINWEERIFQLAKEIHFSHRTGVDVPPLYSFMLAKEYVDEYKKYYEENLVEGEKPKREKPSTNNEDDEFVERMYAMYPTKCPVQNRSLGKSHKDKAKIKALLKAYTKEQIEQVFKEEIDSKYGKLYMRNFSTFLNNFPEPNAVEVKVKTDEPYYNEKGNLIINGVEYR